jgi:predicted permease
MKDASADSIRATLREVHRSLASVPGARAVSLSWAAVPLAADDEDLFWIEGQPKPSSANDMNWALSYVVEEDYLETMGIPLLHGRFFNAQDNERAAHIVVIDDVFAHQYFPDRDPLGKRINLDSKGGVAEIVGVVGHVKQWGLDSDDKQSLRAQLYVPYMQLPDQAMLLSANGTGALAKFDNLTPDTAANLRTALKRMNGDQVMYGVQSMEEVIADTLQTRRAGMVVLGTFAALALGLASIGIYGVISYLVSQRTREIGIRVALGAKRTDVFGMILSEGLKMILLGLGIGFVAAIAMTRLMASLLFGVSATDPITFLAVAAILTVVALAACYVPARRATKVDPIVALRYE